MSERRNFVVNAVGLGLLTCVGGCGRMDVPTSGAVRLDNGSPVTSGSIEFRRVSDKASFASQISPNGTFQPAGEDGTVGLARGSSDVVIVQIALTEDLALEDHTHGQIVPRRFADYYTSELCVVVDDGQSNPNEITIAERND